MARNSQVHERKLAGSPGFTLLELLVAMVVFLVVTASIWSVLRIAMQSRSVVSNQVNLARNVRIGLNLIGRDTYNAGFGYPLRNSVVLPDNRISNRLGLPNDNDSSRDTVPPILAGDNITTNTYNTVPNIKTDQITLLFKDSTFNLVGPTGSEVSQSLNINAATTLSGIDEIIPIAGSTSACRVNDIYLITGNAGSTLGVATGLSGGNKIQFANGDPLGFNQTGLLGPLRAITTPASLHRVLMVTYFVTPDGTLTRREFANNSLAAAFVDDVLVYGVEDFQIQYILDTGAIVDDPAAGPDGVAGTADDTPSNLAAVRQVRFTISVRSVELNSAGQPYRETMTVTYGTRNLGYDAS
jgi:prepilin-type N-terminal cleavage/methylation domain-containing protein